MISDMSDTQGTDEPQANLLCKSCGLCCTGHLFSWTKLRSAELDSMEALGLRVFRSPQQRGFNQPCPLWKGECTIYTSPDYPHFCHTYKCKLLKELLNESTSLTEALKAIERTKGMIGELEALLPVSQHRNFRERLAAWLEELDAQEQLDPYLRSKGEALLTVYEQVFGVNDLVDRPELE